MYIPWKNFYEHHHFYHQTVFGISSPLSFHVSHLKFSFYNLFLILHLVYLSLTYLMVINPLRTIVTWVCQLLVALSSNWHKYMTAFVAVSYWLILWYNINMECFVRIFSMTWWSYGLETLQPSFMKNSHYWCKNAGYQQCLFIK